MPIKDEIEHFKVWAMGMGCPVEKLPSDESLKFLFRSRQSTVFFSMMERVRPLKECREIRQNIFISKMEKVTGNSIDKCERSFGPKEFQRYCEIQDIEKQKKKLEDKCNELAEECNNQDIKAQLLRKQRLSNEVHNLEVKSTILELQCEQFETKIIEAQNTKEKLEKWLPSKPTVQNTNEECVNKAISNAMNELDEFYNISFASPNVHYIEEVKKELWSKLRNIFSKIPNSSLMESLMKMKDEQYQNIKELALVKKTNPFSLHSDITDFEKNIIKAKANLMNIIAKYCSAKKEEEFLQKKFTECYEKFHHDILLKFTSIHPQASEKDLKILETYIDHYCRFSYNSAINDYLCKQTDKLKKEVEERNKLTEDHEILLGSLKEIYSEIDLNIKRTQENMIQLHQIKDKIQYSKMVLQQITDEIKSKINGESFCLNLSMSGLDICGPKLSSTRLDLDVTNSTFINGTLRSTDSTLVNVTSRSNPLYLSQNGVRGLVPQYSIELATFRDIPMTKFLNVAKECQWLTTLIPLITDSDESVHLIQNIPGILMTPERALMNFKLKINWYKQLKNFEQELIVDYDIPQVEEKAIKKMFSDQKEEVELLFDEIQKFASSSQILWKDVENAYNLIFENRLKKYIPKTKLFNNQPYSAYEAEYQMYYQIFINTRYNKN